MLFDMIEGNSSPSRIFAHRHRSRRARKAKTKRKYVSTNKRPSFFEVSFPHSPPFFFARHICPPISIAYISLIVGQDVEVWAAFSLATIIVSGGHVKFVCFAHNSLDRPLETQKYSVLILGSTQDGKSTLIQHIKRYADPDYVIDESLLGNGIVSKTEDTKTFVVESDLPAYETYRMDTGEVIELHSIATKSQTQDDYLEILHAREGDVGMRLTPKDLPATSKHMTFQFLDTPGLNNTYGKDSEYVSNIVNEIIDTRSFNLIVFVISSKNPLTEEKQLALEYFAYVLRGLHSRIVFLYTHVDYAEAHRSNAAHHLDMSMRNKTLSTIFRRHDSLTTFDKNSIEMYPSFTIDLVNTDRPIIQGLIRSTIREILVTATAPPVVLDVSSESILRIRVIAYPTEFGPEQRKKLESELRAIDNSRR